MFFRQNSIWFFWGTTIGLGSITLTGATLQQLRELGFNDWVSDIGTHAQPLSDDQKQLSPQYFVSCSSTKKKILSILSKSLPESLVMESPSNADYPISNKGVICTCPS